MRAMKDSGVEWIGEIPAEWNIIRNKYLLYFEKGKLPNFTNKERIGQPYIGASDLDSKDEYNLYTEDETLPDVDYDDLLILWDGANAGKCARHKRGKLSSTMMRVRSKDTIYQGFLYWYYKGFEDFMYTKVTGTTIPHMNVKFIEDIRMFDIPLHEQQRITDYLDKKCAEIDAIISKQHSIIEKLKEYKLSLITETVTKGLNADAEMKDSGIEWIGEIPKQWEVSRIKYICQFSPSCDISELDENSIVAYAPMECIKNGYFIEKYIKYGKLPKALTPFEDGDIVMAKVTPCFENGNISIMQNLRTKIGFGSSELFVFRTEKINKKFLFYWLQNLKFVEVAKSTMTGTGGLKRVSSKFVENSYICMPDFKAQKEIVDYLDNKCIKIEKIIIDKQKLISKLTEYKKSLIYEVVTGKKEV